MLAAKLLHVQGKLREFYSARTLVNCKDRGSRIGYDAMQSKIK